jgi:enoyl-CoA hydratase/carnithine racemase
MIRELLDVVARVEADPSIRGLWIESSEDKAFCAGGDVRDVTNQGQRGGLTDVSHASDYLADEYLLDVALRLCSKPVFAWGDGYIMGGGMGVFQGADVRFVTEHSNLAMPEVRIGFVPDCGGSWFLHRVPGGLGICLSMSGVTVSAGDACWLNLADWLMPRVEKETLYQSILNLPFASKATALGALGTQLAEATGASPRQGPWEMHGLKLSHAIRHQTPKAVWSVMQHWHHEVPELFVGLEQASPGASLVAGHQFQRARYGSLVEAVIQEHDLGMRMLTDGEWCEGVRALLIDKDKNPQWRFSTVESVTKDWIEAMLAPMNWSDGHPLQHRLLTHGYLNR